MIRTRRNVSRGAVRTAAPLIGRRTAGFRPMILSRHPSHRPLRTQLSKLPFRSVVRLGSTTVRTDIVANGGNRVECNSVQGVSNSSSKLRMKQCFDRAGVRHANWLYNRDSKIGILEWSDRVGYPIISKSLHGSRGRGNTKHDNRTSLERFIASHDTGDYIFEKFIPMTREYRLHVTSEGCFYTCRKLVRNDAPANTWQRHDDVCTWIVENNPSFKKPNNWNAIVADCVTALEYLGLDIGAFDVMVQGSREGVERNNPEWIICESCSAPSFGEITTQKYIEEIPKVLRRKYENRRV